jgi:MFS family permease
LSYIFYAAVLASVLYDLWHIRLPQCSQTFWLQAIIIILAFAHPWTAMLSIFLLSLPAVLPSGRIKPMLRYLVPIVIFTFANKICTAIPGNISLFGIPASVTIPTILSLILFCIIVVMLYRDAHRARLPRLWLCASAIGSAPVATMCCLFAQQEQDGTSSVENNNPDNNLQTS